MTPDEIIEAARKAGFNASNGFSLLIVRHSNGSWVDVSEELTRFAALVRNAALEEAAVVCEAVGQEANLAWRSAYLTLDQGIERGADDCADTIRKLKETK